MITLLTTLALAAPYDEEVVRDAMAGHWAAATQARDGVIAGDLQKVQAAGRRWVLDSEAEWGLAEEAHDRLSPHFEKLSSVRSLDEGSALVGQIAQTCGRCHAENATTRSWEPPMPTGPTAMEHHRAGAEWMWIGLVASSDPFFERGVKVLAQGNLVPSGLPEGDPSRKAIQAMEVQVQDLAGLASRTSDVGERGRAYGEILRMCMTCHRATGGGPDPKTTSVSAPSKPQVLTAQMHERFGLLTAGRLAVQTGDVEAARARGKDLVLLEPPTGLDDPWKPFIAELKADAAALRDAESRGSAARAVAQIAVTCAGCHEVMEAGPGIPTRDQLTFDASSARDRGLDVLWLSLITGSDAGWGLGAEVLSANKAMVAYAANKATDAEARAEVYAKILAEDPPK